MIKYYFYKTMSGRIASLHKLDVDSVLNNQDSENVISDRWDLEKKEWVFMPGVANAIIGISSENNGYEEISKDEADGYVKKNGGKEKKECVCDSFIDETQDYTLKEWINFDYKDFLGMVLMTVNDDAFNNLKAVSQEELDAGYLTDTQVEALRQVLHTGFDRNWGLKLIAQEIKDKVKPGDVFRMDDEGNIVMGSDGVPMLAVGADRRAMLIARTETVRLGNLGAVNYYEKEGAELVEWVATVFSDRTCEYCMEMNGQTFTPDEVREMANNDEFPAHPGCRCALMQFT